MAAGGGMSEGIGHEIVEGPFGERKVGPEAKPLWGLQGKGHLRRFRHGFEKFGGSTQYLKGLEFRLLQLRGGVFAPGQQHHLPDEVFQASTFFQGGTQGVRKGFARRSKHLGLES